MKRSEFQLKQHCDTSESPRIEIKLNIKNMNVLRAKQECFHTRKIQRAENGGKHKRLFVDKQLHETITFALQTKQRRQGK